MKRANGIYIYILLPFFAALIGIILLFFASLVPESLIRENCVKSAEELAAMGFDASALPSSEEFSFYYDPYTDRLIIMEAYTLNSNNPSSILLNPYYYNAENQDVNSFSKLLNGELDTNVDYFRYWQGFRIFIRPLLMFTSYFGVIEILAILFFVLFAVTISLTGARFGGLASACLGLSIAIFKPGVIAFSLQYVTCFLLMFVFSIIVLKRTNISLANIPVIFCIFGMATQYFDFYTNPPITWAIPVLLLMMDDAFADKRWGIILKTFTAWIYGYVSLWLVKLVLVSFIPGINGFYDGFSSLRYRLGTNINIGSETLIDIKNAIINAWWLSCPGNNEFLVFLALSLLIAVGAILLLKYHGFSALISCGAFLAVAAVPVIWTAVAAQPMNVHAWFQHRILLPFYTGIFMFFVKALQLRQPEDKSS